MEKYRIQAKIENDHYKLSAPNLLHTVIKQLNQKYDCQKILLQATKKYQIKQYNILNLNCSKALQIYQILKSKFYADSQNFSSPDQWFDNQLRLFIWLYVCYSHIYKKTQQDMAKQDWTEFCQVFQGKTSFLFQYQVKVIKKQNKKSKKWSAQEDQSLNLIIKHFVNLLGPIQTYRWSQVAKKLYITSNKKFFRTPKQCRQRWMNHLDPEKVKSKWILSQDYELISHAVKQGKKWAMIAKLMGNTRTQHAVKNRYNSLLRAQLKKHEEIVDQVRVMKKVLTRLKYMVQSKNTQKQHSEIKIKVEIEEEELHKIDGFDQNACLEIQQQGNQIEPFDYIIDIIKQEEPGRKTSINLVFLEQDNMNKQQQSQFVSFEFKPNFPDFL